MNRIRSYLAVDSTTSGAVSDSVVAVAGVGLSAGVYPAYDRSTGRREEGDEIWLGLSSNGRVSAVLKLISVLDAVVGRIRGGGDDGVMVSGDVEGGGVVVTGARPSPFLICDASRLLPIPAWPTIWIDKRCNNVNQSAH